MIERLKHFDRWPSEEEQRSKLGDDLYEAIVARGEYIADMMTAEHERQHRIIKAARDGLAAMRPKGEEDA